LRFRSTAGFEFVLSGSLLLDVGTGIHLHADADAVNRKLASSKASRVSIETVMMSARSKELLLLVRAVAFVSIRTTATLPDRQPDTLPAVAPLISEAAAR